jgi:hypothetical protein
MIDVKYLVVCKHSLEAVKIIFQSALAEIVHEYAAMDVAVVGTAALEW